MLDSIVHTLIYLKLRTFKKLLSADATVDFINEVNRCGIAPG